MKEKKQIQGKNEKGITLIALIVSVIIILVLSGIAISVLVGENRIVYKCSKSKKKN